MISKTMADLCEKYIKTREMYEKLHKFALDFVIADQLKHPPPQASEEDPDKCHVNYELAIFIVKKE